MTARQSPGQRTGPGSAGSAREEVLARIRVALRDGASDSPVDQAQPGQPSAPCQPGEPGVTGPAGGIPRGYRERGGLRGEALLDLLAERLADYKALVRRAAPGRLGTEIAAALAGRGARRVVVPPGLDLPLPASVEAVTDRSLSPSELDVMDGVITGAAAAIAETGTIILDGSPGQGRRAISLVPDYHLCVVRADQVVELVPEAIERLRPAADRPLTWISGPSATSDIELSRVEGVHGPRTLEVILVTGS